MDRVPDSIFQAPNAPITSGARISNRRASPIDPEQDGAHRAERRNQTDRNRALPESHAATPSTTATRDRSRSTPPLTSSLMTGRGPLIRCRAPTRATITVAITRPAAARLLTEVMSASATRPERVAAARTALAVVGAHQRPQPVAPLVEQGPVVGVVDPSGLRRVRACPHQVRGVDQVPHPGSEDVTAVAGAARGEPSRSGRPGPG